MLPGVTGRSLVDGYPEVKAELSALLAEYGRGGARDKAREKRGKLGKMPTIVLVEISRMGLAWMLGPEAMIPALQKILPSVPVAGLGVFTT